MNLFVIESSKSWFAKVKNSFFYKISLVKNEISHLKSELLITVSENQ